MTTELMPPGRLHEISTVDERGLLRDPVAVAEDVARLPGREAFVLTGTVPHDAIFASTLFRRLAGQDRAFTVRLGLAAVGNRAVVEDAARAGCVGIEIEREGVLVSALASGIESSPAAFAELVNALRRIRGLGIATVARLPLGIAEDDEGVFERAIRFCRRALISLPLLCAATIDDASPRRMEPESLDNGLRWARHRLSRRLAICRRSLWPAGSRRLSLAAGFRQRREIAATPEARYTPTMHLLRALNRTVRARPRSRFLPTSLARVDAFAAARRRAWLRTKAASDARFRSLSIQVEGALDVRGARALLERVREALQAGYQRITIDVRGIECVSLDVVTRFLAENKARFLEVAEKTRIENLREGLEALRQQIGDHENLRLLESAAA